MIVDYHIHTCSSDGTYSYTELYTLLKQKQIHSFAITDHDTIDGISPMKSLLTLEDQMITGIEFTCKEERLCDGPPISLHLLGYGFDEHNKALQQALSDRKQRVLSVFSSLIQELCLLGYPIALSDIPISCGIVLQLCDVLQYMEQTFSPLPKQVYDLIDAYHCNLTNANLSIQEVISIIQSASGKVVWAHPFHVYHKFKKVILQEKEVHQICQKLVSYGIQGLEANYLAFSKNQKEYIQAMSEHYQLFTTSGSDFHGSKHRDQIGLEVTSTPW